jgi:hypothetical protein
MPYRISQADPSKMTTEDLHAELESFKELAVEVVQRMAVILAEMRRRKQRHFLHHHAILGFYRSLADKTLSAEAAVILAQQPLIKAVLPLPHADQIAIAYGKEIPVAVVNSFGAIATEAMPIRRMDADTIKRAFGPEGIRTAEAQAEMIRTQSRIERHGMVTVIREEQVLKIGNQKIRPEDLKGPLAALGYSLDLSRNVVAA